MTVKEFESAWDVVTEDCIKQAVSLTGFNKLGLERVFGSKLYSGCQAVVDGKVSREQVHQAYWAIVDHSKQIRKELGL